MGDGLEVKQSKNPHGDATVCNEYEKQIKADVSGNIPDPMSNIFQTVILKKGKHVADLSSSFLEFTVMKQH